LGIRTALGLKADADDAAIVAAVEALKTTASAHAAIARAAGLKDDAKPDAIEAAVKTLASQGDGKTIAAPRRTDPAIRSDTGDPIP